MRSVDQCKKEIVAQLGQALHGGAVNSPVITSIDVRALAGGSIVERNVAEIVKSIEEIARSQQSIQDQGRDFIREYTLEVQRVLSAVRADNEQFMNRTLLETRETMRRLVRAGPGATDRSTQYDADRIGEASEDLKLGRIAYPCKNFCTSCNF